jgi:molybdopterin adenylyltransferase
MTFTAAVVTISDKGSRGEREDRSGPALKEMLSESYRVRDIIIIPDETEVIAATLRDLVDLENVDLIITTGGTGLAKRDVTPEATRLIIDRDLPGFSEIMRSESYRITPHGIISRGITGTRKESLIINLPGSPKAAAECLSFVLKAIPHALSKLKGDTSDCAV